MQQLREYYFAEWDLLYVPELRDYYGVQLRDNEQWERLRSDAWPLIFDIGMHLPHYPIEFALSGLSYEFVSVGPKGHIPKLVLFTEIEHSIYNLAFGDKTGEASLNDLVKSADGDADMLLATVANIVAAFLDSRPDAIVYATGSSVERTRLYQMGIGKTGLWLDDEIAIFGSHSGQWEPFVPGRNYEAFFATKRTNFKL